MMSLSQVINKIDEWFNPNLIEDMGIRFGPFDPLQLTFNIMNALMKKGLISYEEAREIIKASLPSEMPEAEKEALLSSMIQRTSPPVTGQ